MLCNTESYYPEGIDPMIFFQDNSLEKIEVINEYNSLIAKGDYAEANKRINDQEGIYGYFADFFNAIENRIFKLQEYLETKTPPKRPYVFFDASDVGEEPDIEVNMFWI